MARMTNTFFLFQTPDERLAAFNSWGARDHADFKLVDGLASDAEAQARKRAETLGLPRAPPSLVSCRFRRFFQSCADEKASGCRGLDESSFVSAKNGKNGRKRHQQGPPDDKVLGLGNTRAP
jgi:hypothetical protein